MPDALTCAAKGCDRPVTSKHPAARFCCNACKSATWRATVGYKLTATRQAGQTRKRRRSRDGMGQKLYLTTAELRALARGEVLASVDAKARRKLSAAFPAPIEGQTDLLTELARTEEPHADDLPRPEGQPAELAQRRTGS